MVLGFKDKYSRTLERSNGSYKYGYKKSLLEFFGFEYRTWESPYTQNVWIDDSSYLGGKRRISNTEYDRSEGYSRAQTPTGRAAELENQFVQLQGESFNPLSSPYIPTSVMEYYDSLPFPGKAEASIGCASGVLLSIVWLLLGKFTLPLITEWFGVVKLGGTEVNGLIWFFVTPIVVCLITTAIGGIIQGILRAKYGKKPEYWKLSVKEKEQYRQEYLSEVAGSFSGEAGKILKEYAILRGYDHI